LLVGEILPWGGHQRRPLFEEISGHFMMMRVGMRAALGRAVDRRVDGENLMKLSLSRRLLVTSGLTAAAAAATLSPSRTLLAAPCSEQITGRAIYGSGGSAVTPTLKNVAVALLGLPEEERITVLFHDPGACTGYGILRTPEPTLEVAFKYWNAEGAEFTCEATQDVVQFAHMGNTPALCPGDVPLTADLGQFVGPVQTINLITHADSNQDRISAEALYHIFGFGPGATGRTVAPWSNPNSVFVRRPDSFVHQIIAESVRVPGANFQLPTANFLQRNGEIVNAVDAWGDSANPDEALAYVSGSNAVAGEDAGQIKSLAYQHFDQTCSYLPDSSRTRRDKLNVRSGQYWLWTPAWFYAPIDELGKPAHEDVARLIAWFDGTQAAPEGVDVQEIIIQSGDVPLCAMQAMRSVGDLSPILSYAPENPCNGWYEFTATGTTEYQTCDETSECTGDGEACRFGFCEAY
jgi:hypothetical protein